MRMMLVSVAACAMLAACSREAEETSAESAGADRQRSASTNAASTAAAAMTQRKEGLWEMSIVSSAGPGMQMTGQMCIDKATAEDFNVQPSDGNQNCTSTKLRPVADGWAYSATCKSDGQTVISEGTVKGDLSRSYTVDVNTRMDPAPEGMADGMKATIRAKWLGPCQPGQTPGKFSMKGMNLGG
jgi:hypothetical protein